MRRLLLMSICFFPILAACAALTGNMLPEGVTTHDTAKGTVFANAKGMTLYTFDKDSKGISNCYGACAKKWPPLIASANEKPTNGFTLVKRKDGTHQIAYHGKPLYTWFKDSMPGDIKGDGVKGVWHIAKP